MGFFSLQKRRLWKDLLETFQHPKRACKKAGEGLLTRACRDRTRANGFKIKEGMFRLAIRKTFFTVRMVRHWNKLFREAVDAQFLEMVKARLEGSLSSLL